jgi:uncharacterized membrane protein
MLSFPHARSFLVPLLAGIGIAFPVLVYFGLRVLPPGAFVAGLLALVGLRLLISGRVPTMPLTPVLWIMAAGLVLFGGLAPMATLKAYPIAISLGLAAVFGWSLLSPPSAIERIARLREPDLPASATGYLRNVTVVWFCFFLINASISTWTTWGDDLELWTLYNGFVSYIFIGALFVGEIAVRHFVRRRPRHAP